MWIEFEPAFEYARSIAKPPLFEIQRAQIVVCRRKLRSDFQNLLIFCGRCRKIAGSLRRRCLFMQRIDLGLSGLAP